MTEKERDSLMREMAVGASNTKTCWHLCWKTNSTCPNLLMN